MKKITMITDIVFISFCVFLFSFAVCGCFVFRSAAFTLSLMFALIFCLFLTKIYISKHKKTKQLLDQDKKLKDVACELEFMSPIELKKLFIEAFNKNGERAIRQRKYIFLCDKNVLVYVKFSFEKITKAEIVSLFNSLLKGQTGIIISSAYSDDIKDFAARFDNKITLKNVESAYRILQKADSVPPITHKNIFISSKKSNIKNIFNKKHAKRFFLLGVYFTVFSFFVNLKIYYVIVGGVFLIVSAIIRFFGKDDEIYDKVKS